MIRYEQMTREELGQFFCINTETDEILSLADLREEWENEFREESESFGEFLANCNAWAKSCPGSLVFLTPGTDRARAEKLPALLWALNVVDPRFRFYSETRVREAEAMTEEEAERVFCEAQRIENEGY